ncbi:MAG: hypothetical protein QF382_05180, partial [Acidimicrobiales bacterium]|nr:hypothetical protein [Acidimicrobiales bacterium]
MRRQVTYVVGIIAISVAGLVYTFASGNEPLLGLDLQGGASVVLEPEPLPDGQEITEETLDQAVDIIRNRVDGLVDGAHLVREGRLEVFFAEEAGALELVRDEPQHESDLRLVVEGDGKHPVVADRVEDEADCREDGKDEPEL